MATAASGRWTSASEGASEGATSAAVVGSTSWLDTLITSRRTLLVLHATGAHAGMLASSAQRSEEEPAMTQFRGRTLHGCSPVVNDARKRVARRFGNLGVIKIVKHRHDVHTDTSSYSLCTSPVAVITTAPPRHYGFTALSSRHSTLLLSLGLARLQPRPRRRPDLLHRRHESFEGVVLGGQL